MQNTLVDKILTCTVKIRDLKEELLRIAIIEEYLRIETNKTQQKKTKYQSDLRLFEKIMEQANELEGDKK